LISAPTVNEKITGGRAVITANSRGGSQTLVTRLNSGALPCDKLISQTTVESSLGAKS